MLDFEELRIDAFAKLTLSLHITGTRADGYHELDATMVSITAPYDALLLRPALLFTQEPLLVSQHLR